VHFSLFSDLPFFPYLYLFSLSFRPFFDLPGIGPVSLRLDDIPSLTFRNSFSPFCRTLFSEWSPRSTFSDRNCNVRTSFPLDTTCPPALTRGSRQGSKSFFLLLSFFFLLVFSCPVYLHAPQRVDVSPPGTLFKFPTDRSVDPRGVGFLFSLLEGFVKSGSLILAMKTGSGSSGSGCLRGSFFHNLFHFQDQMSGHFSYSGRTVRWSFPLRSACHLIVSPFCG